MSPSDAQLRTLKAKERPYKVGDSDGLYVTVTPSGSRLWHLRSQTSAGFAFLPWWMITPARTWR